MNTWLIDTALFKVLASSRATPVLKWCEVNDASLFLSTASLTELMLAIAKIPRGQAQRREELRKWLDGLTSRFPDRVHAVDAEISMRAGAILPLVAAAYPPHRRHDAILVATAQVHGHGLLTRRDGVFGKWTQTPIAVI